MTDLRRAVETEYAFKPAKISALNRFLLKGGQGEMVDSVRAILVNNDIEMKNIFSEKYD